MKPIKSYDKMTQEEREEIDDAYAIWTRSDMALGMREISEEEERAEQCPYGCTIDEGCLYHHNIGEECQWCERMPEIPWEWRI